MTFLDSSGQVLHTVRVEDSSESTHAIITPNHFALRIETPELFLHPNTEYTIRVHEGVVEGKLQGCGYLLSQAAEWTFRTDGKTFHLPSKIYTTAILSGTNTVFNVDSTSTLIILVR